MSGQRSRRFVRIAPEILLSTSISGIFFAKKISRISRIWGKITTFNLPLTYLEKMISVRRFDLAVSKKISNLSGFAPGCFQIFLKKCPGLCQGSLTIDRSPTQLTLSAKPLPLSP